MSAFSFIVGASYLGSEIPPKRFDDAIHPARSGARVIGVAGRHRAESRRDYLSVVRAIRRRRPRRWPQLRLLELRAVHGRALGERRLLRSQRHVPRAITGHDLAAGHDPAAARVAPTGGVLSKWAGTDVLIDGVDVLDVIEEKRRSTTPLSGRGRFPGEAQKPGALAPAGPFCPGEQQRRRSLACTCAPFDVAQ